jgi:hypothetical protein
VLIARLELVLMTRGRALDTAPPALYTLLEIRKNCPEILDKCEVRQLLYPSALSSCHDEEGINMFCSVMELGQITLCR